MRMFLPFITRSPDRLILSNQGPSDNTGAVPSLKDTKGAPKVGDKVTVHYTMIANEIEVKPAAPKK
jgi:hypothetical protein